MDIRKETDSLGEVEVPADKLWGAQTQRSLEHFSTGKNLIPREMITAYTILKKAAANANHASGRAPCTRSFGSALHALTAFQAPGLLDVGQPLILRYEQLFRRLIRHRIGNRPGRAEPRAVKRRPSKYPFLTKPRQQARDELLQNLQ